jgi:hypothetical protein
MPINILRKSEISRGICRYIYREEYRVIRSRVSEIGIYGGAYEWN